jgi:magnesium chelatase family protein
MSGYLHLSVVHHGLMTGHPGAGKTLVAKSLPGIFPRMSIAKALEVSKIISIADLLPADTPLIPHRPFRAPNHTINWAGLVNEGTRPKKGLYGSHS